MTQRELTPYEEDILQHFQTEFGTHGELIEEMINGLLAEDDIHSIDKSITYDLTTEIQKFMATNKKITLNNAINPVLYIFDMILGPLVQKYAENGINFSYRYNDLVIQSLVEPPSKCCNWFCGMSRKSERFELQIKVKLNLKAYPLLDPSFFEDPSSEYVSTSAEYYSEYDDAEEDDSEYDDAEEDDSEYDDAEDALKDYNLKMMRILII